MNEALGCIAAALLEPATSHRNRTLYSDIVYRDQTTTFTFSRKEKPNCTEQIKINKKRESPA